MAAAPKTALITGITGQDGSYLSEWLLSQSYRVVGMMRRTSLTNTQRIDHLLNDPALKGRLELVRGDITDALSLRRLLEHVQPNEIYHLAGQSQVMDSFHTPELSTQTTGMGTLNLLEALRQTQLNARFYNAASSEMFGRNDGRLLDESSPFQPCSPYGCAKLLGYWNTRNYRDAYGLFACNGIMFNHESPRRDVTFVTRKISQGVAQIKAGRKTHLELGNLNARRDWGYSPDYVRGMWLMLQHPEPLDLVFATGVSHSVADFAQAAFAHAELDDWQRYININETFQRPLDIDDLKGNSQRARQLLGWESITSFDTLVKYMVGADLAQEAVNLCMT